YKRPVAMECARQLVAGRARPDAIFVGNDHMAFGVLDALRHAGLEPGTDISVVGYDDVPLAAWGAYALTTFRQPVNRMVEATVNILIDQIETETAKPESVEFEGELVLRRSARIPEGLANEGL
ncbi:MAG: substrate-binding domain-containing protein, partial [Boseongicola sp.]|nr:substrate-binding domain-containing protein [Boseongicola sp.]